MLNLDEANAAFDKTPRRQQLHAKRLRHVRVQAVQPLGFLALLVEAHCLRHGHLHAESQFITFDPRFEGLVAWMFNRPEPIQFPDQIELDRLFGIAEIALGPGVGERFLRIDLERHRVEGGSEITPVACIKETRAHVDELREILVQRAEAVIHPGADRRFLHIEHVPARVELHLRAVVVVRRPHGADHGNIIHAVPEVREPVADLDAAAAAGLEADLERINLVSLLAVGVVDHHHPNTFEFVRIVDALERRLRECLALVPIECWLRIETFHVAQPAAEEDPDDTPGLRGEVGQASRRTPAVLAPEPFARQQGAQCETSKAKAGAREERPARQRRRATKDGGSDSWEAARFVE